MAIARMERSSYPGGVRARGFARMNGREGKGNGMEYGEGIINERKDEGKWMSIASNVAGLGTSLGAH